MRCPSCKNKVIQKTGETTRVRLDGPLLLDPEGRARGRCYWCKQEIPLPLTVQAAEPVESERYYVRPKP